MLFPAITILILAYSNRFSTLSNKIREFIRKNENQEQINVFKRRIQHVRRMLIWGIIGLIGASASMLALAGGIMWAGIILFVVADISIMTSLVYALCDVMISTHALEIELSEK